MKGRHEVLHLPLTCLQLVLKVHPPQGVAPGEVLLVLQLVQLHLQSHDHVQVALKVQVQGQLKKKEADELANGKNVTDVSLPEFAFSAYPALDWWCPT